MFQRGEVGVNEIEKWCNTHGSQISKSSNGNITVFKFQYQGKSYSVSCNQTNNHQGNQTGTVYTYEQLKNSYGLDSNTIGRYFNQVDSNKFVFNPDC